MESCNDSYYVVTRDFTTETIIHLAVNSLQRIMYCLQNFYEAFDPTDKCKIYLSLIHSVATLFSFYSSLHEATKQ